MELQGGEPNIVHCTEVTASVGDARHHCGSKGGKCFVYFCDECHSGNKEEYEKPEHILPSEYGNVEQIVGTWGDCETDISSPHSENVTTMRITVSQVGPELKSADGINLVLQTNRLLNRAKSNPQIDYYLLMPKNLGSLELGTLLRAAGSHDIRNLHGHIELLTQIYMQLHPSQTENIHIFPSVIPDVFEGDHISSDNILRGHSEHSQRTSSTTRSVNMAFHELCSLFKRYQLAVKVKEMFGEKSRDVYLFSPQGERVIEENTYNPLVIQNASCCDKINVEDDLLQGLNASRPVSLRTLIIFTHSDKLSLCEQQTASSLAASLGEKYHCGNVLNLTPSLLTEFEDQSAKVPTLRRQIDRLAYMATHDPLQLYIIVRESFSLLPKEIDPYLPLSDRLMEIPNICMSRQVFWDKAILLASVEVYVKNMIHDDLDDRINEECEDHRSTTTLKEANSDCMTRRSNWPPFEVFVYWRGDDAEIENQMIS